MAKGVALATQEFVPIQEIRDGVVILKDGTMRMALLVSSINFALKYNGQAAQAESPAHSISTFRFLAG